MMEKPFEGSAVHVQLTLIRRGDTLTGWVGTDGTPAKAFTGWIALNAAIDDLVMRAEVTDGEIPRSGEANAGL